MSKPSSSSSSSSSSGVTVLWDYENAWIPDGYDIKTLRGNIEAALKKGGNPDFFIYKKLIAIGPPSGPKYRTICTVPNDIKFSPIPVKNMMCDTQGAGCKGLVVQSQGDPEEQIMRKTDAADKYLLKKVFMKAIDKRPNILLISGDIDFGSAIDGLYNRGTMIMLALTENSKGDFYDCAKKTWRWSSEDPEKATMIKGGGPIKKRIRG